MVPVPVVAGVLGVDGVGGAWAPVLLLLELPQPATATAAITTTKALREMCSPLIY